MGTFELALVGVFAFLIFLRALAVVVVAFAVIRPVLSCPACFLPTVPVRVPWRLLLPASFEWRGCPACGWQGPGRREPGKPGARTSRAPGVASPTREDRRSRPRERGAE